MKQCGTMKYQETSFMKRRNSNFGRIFEYKKIRNRTFELTLFMNEPKKMAEFVFKLFLKDVLLTCIYKWRTTIDDN